MIRMVWGNAFNLRGKRGDPPGAEPTSAPSARGVLRREDLVRLTAPRALAHHADVERAIRASANGHVPVRGGLSDLVLNVDEPLDSTDDVFRRLRWGGQVLFVTRDRRRARKLSKQLVERGFCCTRAGDLRTGGLPIPFLARRVHYVAARKVDLVLPREVSDRFTYHVHLIPWARSPQGFIVQKEVPSVERVVNRLRHKFPDVPAETVEKRARKFTEKIFPVFLTREAAMLQILEKHLPGPYRRRVPHVIELEKDDRGLVRVLRMNWLRNGGPTISQVEFAKQAAELLHVLHDRAGVIHLDLRLDNFVLTEHGVGFVDFGSAVRVGEDLRANPMLGTIFDELMRTSQIQRMLEQMTYSGQVTSQYLKGAQGRVDKAVDLFYLAVQINNPVQNPEFEGLVAFDPNSAESHALAEVTADVLKPHDPLHPHITTAADFLRNVVAVEQSLARGRPVTPVAASA
jgi:hypothetical protein